jgi:DnaJ-class molecular chaperone
VSISAGPEEIREAFRRLSRKYHPDRNPGSVKKFEKINVAYETLSNENKKYLYDRLGSEKMDDPNIQQERNIA